MTLPFMPDPEPNPEPDPEPDPVPVWNGSFTQNEEQYPYITFSMLCFFKEAIKQQKIFFILFFLHCLLHMLISMNKFINLLLLKFR